MNAPKISLTPAQRRTPVFLGCKCGAKVRVRRTCFTDAAVARCKACGQRWGYSCWTVTADARCAG